MTRNRSIARAVTLGLLGCQLASASRGATLPVPCAGTACGPGVSGFVGYGQATAVSTGPKLTVNQASNNAILNWSSFNISADGSVRFVQPNTGSVALNQIYDSNPTQIFGALNANGRVFLINQNGIIFGAGAQVNVGGLLASTLNINSTYGASDSVGMLGLLNPALNGQPAFQAATDANGNVLSKAVTISPHATIQAADGGQILIFAPEVTNAGTISSPDGQTVLAAGNSVYLTSSSDPNLRGLLVEVQGTGTVTNGVSSNAGVQSPADLVGQIVAERGNVTLAGLAVNQLGRISATTSVNENGSIRLQAGQGQIEAVSSTSAVAVPGTGGTLTLGQSSDTEVTLDSSNQTTVDSVAQPKSQILMSGATIDMLSGSVARATSGSIDITAAQNLGEPQLTHTSDGSQFYMAPDALLDVSGASTTLPVSDNVLAVKLLATELADSPLQRNGVLHGATVDVDIRETGTLSNGSQWWGTPVANVSGAIEAIPHNVVERNLTGGTVTVSSQGDVILSPGSNVDIAGGYIQYTGGYVNTTRLVAANGMSVPIGSADPNMPYLGVENTLTVTSTKWGVSTTYNTVPNTYEAGYLEGKDAGTFSLATPAFILDGNINAQTVVGPYQRLPTGSVPNLPGSLYRPFDEVPEGGTLVIGAAPNANSDFVLGNLTIEPTAVLASLRNPDGSAFDPLLESLPASFTTSILRPALLSGPDGVTHVDIDANGQVILPSSVSLELGPGGSFSVLASTIDLNGSIDAPGGAISATAQNTVDSLPAATALTLGPEAALTVRGEWVNDSAALYPGGNTAPLYINGGSVSLTVGEQIDNSASPDLRLMPGSLIDVSAGAWLTTAGALTAGTGGTITIDAATPHGDVAGAPPYLQLGAQLRGYALGNGGTLAITAANVCIAASDCAAGTPTSLWLSPQFLTSGGFGAYEITADQGSLSVAPGTTLQLEQQNFMLRDGFWSQPNAASMAGLATVTTLPQQVRTPTDLSLTLAFPATDYDPSSGAPDILTVQSSSPSLTIGQGAFIGTDPLGRISLASDTRIIIDGTLRAPGGAISAELDSAFTETTYEPSQAIWLGANGRLDASGIAEVSPNAFGLPTGQILPGGTVSLIAQRGYLELLPGSQIDVVGASGTLAVQPPGSDSVLTEQLASAGGSIDLTAAEGMSIGSQLMAAAGTAAAGTVQPAGGTLSVTLDPSLRGDYSQGTSSDTFPLAPRQIVVGASFGPVVVAPGSAVPMALAGVAQLPADTIEQDGFSVVALRTASTNGLQFVPIFGDIRFTGNVTLNASQEVSLDSATYSVDPGYTAQVSAPYIEFGNSDTTGNVATAYTSPTGPVGTLKVSGNSIELYGSTALVGIGTVSFDAVNDLRLRGLQTNNGGGVISGGLFADGTVNLDAQQIYPATLTQFTISADPATVTNLSQLTSGVINISGSQGSNTELLSAGGAITLSAASINQNGVLRAPLGTLDFYGNSISLGSNSLTSTSLDGLTVPFGTTQGGIDWVYPLANFLETIYGTDGVAPPAQNIALNGTNVTLQHGAAVDLSGGGNLQAYEWIPGTQGTQDVLASSTLFAIIPDLKANIAPYDPAASAGSTLQLGDAVHLDAGSGVPAGTYLLLPARYALLPGAYVVSEVSGYQNIQPGQQFTVAGGGTIVAGYRTTLGLSTGSSQANGFEVTPASVVMQEAQYNLTEANAFFSAQEAQAAATSSSQTAAPPTFRLPEDGGVLALVAGTELTLDGTLRTSVPAGARGAEVDISNPDIFVTSSGDATADPGALVLSASSLNQLGVQTLLLGGQSSASGIETTAQTVTIGDGASLQAPQLLLTAQDQVTVASGATITAAGNAPASSTYALSGDGAFLSVSSGPQSVITRSGAVGAQGTLLLAAGSTVSAADGSIYLDATSAATAQGAIVINGGDLAVQTPQIALGTPSGSFSGTALGQNILGAANLRSLELTSGSGIAIYPGANVSAQSISIDAPGFESELASGQTITLSGAETLSVQNSQGGSLGASSGTNAGALVLNGGTITLADGFATNGFASTALDAAGAVRAVGSGSFTVSGDLTISAATVTADADINQTLTAAGSIAVLPGISSASAAVQPELGGRLTLVGTAIDVDTRFDLPSGSLALQATDAGGNGITLDRGAVLNVAGVTQDYGTTTLATPGGVVSLSSAASIGAQAGSEIDVSAAPGAAGGSLAIAAPGGAVQLAGTLNGAGSPSQGAAFAIDAQSFDFQGLNEALNAGGFNGGRSFRLRGGAGIASNLTVAAGPADAVTAHDVLLEADNGSIDIEGVVNASGPSGGTVLLAAANGITVNGTIDAHATAAGETGGSVQLDLEQPSGQVVLGSSSLINLRGGGSGDLGDGAGGTLLVRVPAQTAVGVGSGGSGVVMQGTVQGATRTTLEGFSIYSNTTGVISAEDISADPTNPMYADAAAFMSSSGAIAAALGKSSDPTFVVEPGVEIDAVASATNPNGSLELDMPWNLYGAEAAGTLSGWRFAGSNGSIVPGVLTLRAQGAITFNASLSDGFTATSGTGAFTLPTTPSDSWSYRIVAGADMSAANPLAVNVAAPADVTIAACSSSCSLPSGGGRGGSGPGNYAPVMVRTGDGFIDVAASGDLVFGSGASMLYTAGVASPVAPPSASGRATPPLQGLYYPLDGGDIRVDVAGNVVGADDPSTPTQFVTAWLWRQGGLSPSDVSTAWSVNFQDFQQGLAALGGGDVTVKAGGDIVDFSASIPTVGIQTGGSTNATSVVQIADGGNLQVEAGGSILGGSYYVGRGSATLSAGNDVGLFTHSDGVALSPLIGLGDASLQVTARGSVQLSGIVDPLLLNTGVNENGSGSGVYFSTYGPNSSATLTAIGGNAVLADEYNGLEQQFGPSFATGQIAINNGNNLDGNSAPLALSVLPPSLTVYAASNDIVIDRVISLFPSSQGNLRLFADQDINAAGGAGVADVALVVPDADPALLPSIATPQADLNSFQDIVNALGGSSAAQHAPTPLFASVPAFDENPVVLTALNGSITFPGGGGGSGIWSGKPVLVSAGTNIVNLSLVAQNLSAGDVTSINAGRDILYPQSRGPNGAFLNDDSSIVVSGPGELQVTAGRDIDLGTSFGITTNGNQSNSALPGNGASISVQAGVGAGVQYASFIAKYIDASTDFDAEVVGYLDSLGYGSLSPSAAKQIVNAMPEEQQRTLVEQIFFNLLQTYGTKAADTGNNADFAGAYAAIQTLFPGANPNLAQNQTNPYSGDLLLYFSQIYTLDGGDISLLVPGGLVNAGLALAPTSYGLSKSANDLGIVAARTGNVQSFSYGDFEVNQSRVFAADGGNILVWSTEGDIDAGRGAKTALSAASPIVTYDNNGLAIITDYPPTSGSGIQALADTAGVDPGSVYLFAPHGVVNANDAGIVAGNLTVAATAVLGTNNISVSGTEVGVPIAATGLGASVVGASSAASGAINAATENLTEQREQSQPSAADSAMGWLDVFILGFGEESCKAEDQECLKRQKQAPH